MSMPRFVAISALLFSISCWASSSPQVIKIAVTNPSAEQRSVEHIVVPMSLLRKSAPGLNAGSLMVTAADPEAELPSQVDDLDGDNKADELAFEIDLKPHQTRIVSVTYGTPGDILPIRSQYPPHTNAILASKIEGPGWESEENAYRLYFDDRNAIDLYGKRRHTLMLNLFATPEYDYHAENPYGRDIYKIGDALGIGAVGAWVDGKIVKVAKVASRECRVISTGPVRAIVELTYKGWSVNGRSVTLHSRITQWAGDHGFYHTVTVDDASGITFATGLPLKSNVPEFRSGSDSSEIWLATYGEQVLMPGATATEPLQGTNLGLVVIMMGTKAEPAQDAQNRLLTFSVQDNSATWYAAAAWDQEENENQTSAGKKGKTCVTPVTSGVIRNQQEFLRFVRDQAVRLSAPSTFKLVEGP